MTQVCDVGGGTGFCTLGVVQTVRPENVTLVDQSPHQLEKAKAKAALQRVTIKEVCVHTQPWLLLPAPCSSSIDNHSFSTPACV